LTLYETFPNAPITEAVIEILVQLSKNITINDLIKCHDSLKDRFPEVVEQKLSKAGFQLGKRASTLPSEESTIGYLLKSSQDKKVVQSRLNGFAFSKLKPYENWKRFCAEANELWKVYREIVNPRKITRISLRYINRIEVPYPFKDFNEYILTNPQIAPNLPQAVSTFFMRLEIPNYDILAKAILIQTMEQPTQDKKLPLILDIDVMRENEYIRNMDDVWADFESLREFKNEIFFNSITDKTKELFR